MLSLTNRMKNSESERPRLEAECSSCLTRLSWLGFSSDDLGSSGAGAPVEFPAGEPSEGEEGAREGEKEDKKEKMQEGTY